MPPSLEHAFTLRGFFDKKYMLDIKTIKGGPQRTVAPIVRGSLTGDGIEADVIPGGGDWLLINPEDTTAHLDVRLSLRTARPSSGHSIYIRYEGVLQVDAASFPQLTGHRSARSTAFGDHEWFTTPVVETSDPDLKWMERAVFVAEGRWLVEEGAGDAEIGIEYEVYRVRPSESAR